MSRFLRLLWYRPQYLFYRHIYAPFASWRERVKHGNIWERYEAPPCQICGEVGHVERLCPNARELGFIDYESDAK